MIEEGRTLSSSPLPKGRQLESEEGFSALPSAQIKTGLTETVFIMRLNVKEAGADAIFLNSWTCSFDTHASVSHEIFQVEKKKPVKCYVTYAFSYFYL